MIDDKKIEEAASTYGTSNNYSCIGPDGRMSLKPELETAFETGAHWAIKAFLEDLWHSTSEEPKLGRRVLVKINGNLSLFNSGFVVEHIRNFDDCYGIESWLYIDDLFPEEGGNQ